MGGGIPACAHHARDGLNLTREGRANRSAQSTGIRQEKHTNWRTKVVESRNGREMNLKLWGKFNNELELDIKGREI
jgi:hypothetical protein